MREPKSVTAGIQWRGRWDIVGNRGNQGAPEIEVIEDVVSCTKYVWYHGHRDHISCILKTEELFQEHFYWLKAPGGRLWMSVTGRFSFSYLICD